MSDAELRGLLADCLKLWGVDGRLSFDETGLRIVTGEGPFLLQRAPEAMRPVRWFVQTPARQAVGRAPRAAPSIVVALTVLGRSLRGDGDAVLRVGATG